ncbi:MAG: S9 family peptidase, partial [Sulfurimonas sp.]
DKEIDADHIDIADLKFDADMEEIKFIFDKKKISYSPSTNTLTIIDANPSDRDQNRGYWGSKFDETTNPPVMSPDSTMTAFIKNSNLYIKNNKTEEETRLSYDGAPGFFYSSYIKWSPDGKTPYNETTTP